MNLPNAITLGRLGLALIYFVLLSLYRSPPEAGSEESTLRGSVLLDAAFVLFVLAALTDALDGWVARRRGEVTAFGRVSDPFVDKIVICGSFVFFLSFDELQPCLPAWMVVVILGREFAVHSVRTLAEAQGVEFGSNILGKQKMLVQSITVGAALLYAGRLTGVGWTFHVLRSLVWLTLLSTVVSGAVYLAEARKLRRKEVA